MQKAIAGIDIGGTKIAVALADSEGRMLSHLRFPTQVELGAHRILDNTITAIERMIQESGAKLIAIGVGCGGPMNRQRGVILSPTNLPGWDEFPIVEMLNRRFDVPVSLDNDANAAALGEYECGAGRAFDNLVYITISTGIGGGVILGGEIVHGVGDGTGEIGHITVQPDGVPCACGSRGCLEALCSGTNIARRAKERLSNGEQSSMRTMVTDLSDVTAHTVTDAARDGDALAREIWDDTIRFLAIGINNIIVTLAPEAIILGGGVSTAGEQLLAPLRRQLEARVKIMPLENIRIVQAALGGESGIYGALILARRAAASREA
ncbi:MAG: ROK family protein [Pyrinomonadaceae bacterium MAG19_C2-C3]|nr:ROK family protein [Pyrinomonadaceae bacterium MAG19_C2-C3]